MNKLLTTSLSLAALSLCSQMASAQPASKTVLEEMIVTAEFRPVDLQSQSASTSIVVSNAIQQRAAQHLEDVLNLTPNGTFSRTDWRTATSAGQALAPTPSKTSARTTATSTVLRSLAPPSGCPRRRTQRFLKAAGSRARPRSPLSNSWGTRTSSTRSRRR